MIGLNTAAVYVLQTLGSLYLLIVLMRFVLQLVRANFDHARIWGIEHSADARLHRDVSVSTSFTYLRAEDTNTGLPPNIEGGTPAPQFWGSVRYSPAATRWWIEPYVHFGWKQTHLS